MKDNEYLSLMSGGTDGGILLASPVTTGTYDIIIVETGAAISVLENEAATNLLTAKGLTGFTFTAERILSAGAGHTIKKITFTGVIWGYTQ